MARAIPETRGRDPGSESQAARGPELASEPDPSRRPSPRPAPRPSYSAGVAGIRAYIGLAERPRRVDSEDDQVQG